MDIDSNYSYFKYINTNQIFMIKQGTIDAANKFCCEDISKIEGYNEAVNSEKRYCCHHKKGLNISREELIQKGLYYNRPASELIFLSISEHIILHNLNKRDETRKKLSNSLKGAKNPMYGVHKYGENAPHKKQCIINGTTYCSLEEARRTLYPNMPPSTFKSKYYRGEL